MKISNTCPLNLKLCHKANVPYIWTRMLLFPEVCEKIKNSSHKISVFVKVGDIHYKNELCHGTLACMVLHFWESNLKCSVRHHDLLIPHWFQHELTDFSSFVANRLHKYNFSFKVHGKHHSKLSQLMHTDHILQYYYLTIMNIFCYTDSLQVYVKRSKLTTWIVAICPQNYWFFVCLFVFLVYVIKTNKRLSHSASACQHYMSNKP